MIYKYYLSELNCKVLFLAKKDEKNKWVLMGIKSFVVLSLLKYYDILIKSLFPLKPKQCSS